MKGIIVLDEVPKKCNQCNFWFGKATVPVEYRCMGVHREITENELIKEKPDWCPIKLTPDKKDIKTAENMTSLGWIEGWNACIDEIIGEK